VARASKASDAVSDPPGGVMFALDSFEVSDGRLVVSGRWYGVGGRRFVRPVLHPDGQRRLIAVLDHKPWSAEEGVEWLAAFAHDGAVGPSRLQVAPDVAIELPAAGPAVGDGVPRPARLPRGPAKPKASAPEPARKPAKRDKASRMDIERDAARSQVDALREELAAARADSDRVRAEFDQARAASEAATADLARSREETDQLAAELRELRAELQTLRSADEDASSTTERLQEELRRARLDAERGRSELGAAQAAAERARAGRAAAEEELDRLRRAPSRGPYIAPRPVAFNDRDRGAHWGVRAAAAVLVLVVLLVLMNLLFGVF
jgi:hypothetical protein